MANKSAIVEIEIKADAADALKDVGKAESALKDLEQAAHQAGSGADGIKELSDAVADLTAATEAASEGAGGLGEAFAGGAVGGAVVAGISSLGGAVKGAFSKLAELGAEAFSQAMDFDVGRDKLQAQLGLSAEQAKVMGKLAGDLYSQAYGESIGEVNEALRLVTINLGLNADQQAQELQQVTASVLDLASAFDQDLGGVAKAVGQLMRTGLVRDAREALDVITRGFQLGADKGEDLLDTLNEYPTLFRDIGLKADQAMGLLVQGLKAGARDTDQVADALGVFAEMSKTASATTKEAFKTIGLDAEKMLKVFGEGGPAAAEGLDLVLDGLRNMTDPVKQNEAAVALFGDKANELQDALFALDPSTAVAALGEVGGAADKMGKALADNATTRFETWKRTVQTNVITFIADNLLPALDSVGAKAQDAFNQALEAWKAFQRGFTGIEPVSLEVENGQLTSSISAIEGMDPTKGNPMLKQLQDLGEEIRKLSDEWLPKLRDALKEVGDRLNDLTQFFKDNKDAMELLKNVGIAGLIVALLILASIIASVTGAVIIFGLIVLGLLAPFAIVSTAMGRLGITWGDVWNGMHAAVRTAVFIISNWLSTLMFLLKNLLDPVWPDNWATLWDNITGIVRRAKDSVIGFINDIRREINNFLDLAKKVTNPFQLPSFGGNMVAPGAAPVGLMPMAMAGTTAAAAGSSVINVTIQHTGLGVDSPRLQRDIVEALRRYDRRNGRGTS